MNRTFSAPTAVDSAYARRHLASVPMIDIPTLLGVAAAFLVCIAMLLMLLRPHTGGVRSWLAMPFLAGACGCMTLLMPAPDHGAASARLGTFFVLLAFAMGWQAIRAIFRRPARWATLLLPPAGWLILALAVFGPHRMDASDAALRAALAGLYCALAAATLVRERDPRLPSVRTLSRVLMLCAALAAVTLACAAWLPEPLGAAAPQTWAIALFSGALLLSVLLISGLVLAVVKEQATRGLYDAAARDPLTGLHNRRLFDEQQSRWDEEDRASGHARAALFFDIDRFKDINDRFGHDVGDQVIRLAARAAEQALRKHDLIFRYGGEEFVCILPGSTLRAGLAAAERLRANFERMAATVGGHPVRATLSVGVSASSGRQPAATRLVAEADRLMYQAKQSGRNRVIGALPGA